MSQGGDDGAHASTTTNPTAPASAASQSSEAAKSSLFGDEDDSIGLGAKPAVAAPAASKSSQPAKSSLFGDDDDSIGLGAKPVVAKPAAAAPAASKSSQPVKSSLFGDDGDASGGDTVGSQSTQRTKEAQRDELSRILAAGPPKLKPKATSSGPSAEVEPSPVMVPKEGLSTGASEEIATQFAGAARSRPKGRKNPTLKKASVDDFGGVQVQSAPTVVAAAETERLAGSAAMATQDSAAEMNTTPAAPVVEEPAGEKGQEKQGEDVSSFLDDDNEGEDLYRRKSKPAGARSIF